MSRSTTHPVHSPPTAGDIAAVIGLKTLLFLLTAVLPLKNILWLMDRIPVARKPDYGRLARKVSLVQGIKDSRKFHRLVRLNCLKRSLITLYYLRRNGVPGEFHLGINPRRGKFAHAWVSSPAVSLVPALKHQAMINEFYATLDLRGAAS